MNKTAIKNYAIWARNELISRVSQRAFEYGVEKDNILPYDAQSINGRLLSDDEKKKRQVLINEVKRKGYDQVIEEVAYTWFNRFIALRFMEVNNYLPDKVRLFTNENNEFKPQIIDEALHIDLLGLDKNKVLALKEANNNEELYKELLLATCNDMSRYLPGMFKPIDDYMTLLFPSNLLREESVLGRLISDIDKDSWTDQVQIIGWLYQYYNTEPKDKVYSRKSGIKIKKEEIPAVTQLFTPDWIVRYMTENSLGRLWLDGHPNAEIKSNWKYYLDEAEQEESVQIELNKIKTEHAKLKPENIKFLDPCMGSGHILVYAFDVLMHIYVSEGWTEREAAKSILQNNIYGLDIDERAYQLSYFALMMKARQYNRKILSEGIVPNVMAIEESNTFKKELLRRFGDLQPLAERVVNIFIDAKEYGSILNVEFTKEELDSLDERLNEIDKMSDYGNLLDQMESDQLLYDFNPLLKQARIMSQKYECVVTNPPYMGNSGFSLKLSEYVKTHYPNAKNDLYSVMMEKCSLLTELNKYLAMITMQSWINAPTFKNLRKHFFGSFSFVSINNMGSRAFEEIQGEKVKNVIFIIRNQLSQSYKPIFIDLTNISGEKEKRDLYLRHNQEYKYSKQSDFLKSDLCLVVYKTRHVKDIYSPAITLSDVAEVRRCIATGDDEQFIRLWYEVNAKDISSINFMDEASKWYFISDGGERRRWYGNILSVLNWKNDGSDLRAFNNRTGKSTLRNVQFMFQKGLTYTYTSMGSGIFNARLITLGMGSIGVGPVIVKNKDLVQSFAFVNSVVFRWFWDTMYGKVSTFETGNVGRIAYREGDKSVLAPLVQLCVRIAKDDWDSFEISRDFHQHPLIGKKRISEQFVEWADLCIERMNSTKESEEAINRHLIGVYGLQDEVVATVKSSDVTVRVADLPRDIRSLISYSVGCMFGRYSLDVDGLAYAGGEWDDSKYLTFIPDKDNIIPICDDEYFNDDITERFIEFIKAAYGEDTLEENLRFIADALGGKGTSREAIRSYFINDFYNDHIKTYQKRPIYWQFDSGKKNGFKALIYIHRYTPDLIARMRTSYVHEQQSRYENQITMIQNRIDSAASTSERVKAEKELRKLKEQADELRVYEEKIHHWADKMEPMDLDDGVKANYAKFQELLTRIK